MIARITRLLIAFQIAIVIGVYILLHHYFIINNPLAWILAFGVLILARLMMIANTFLIAYHHRSRRQAGLRLGWKSATHLLFQEFWASMLVTSWHMPFLSFTGAITPRATNVPILLIHGYGCNSGYWHNMHQLLVRENISHKAIDLAPLLGAIDDYAGSIDKAVEDLCQSTGQEHIIILAHSMGGLAARAYLRRYGGRRIARIITVGTPHHGTVLANFGIGINALQMRRYGDDNHEQPSDWLCALAKSEDAASRALIISIYSLHDNIVAPQRSCHLPGAKNIALSGIGHITLGLHPTVRALAFEEIRRASER